MNRIKDLDHLLVEALRAAEMRQGCTNHTYYAEIIRKQICQLFTLPLDDKELREKARLTEEEIQVAIATHLDYDPSDIILVGIEGEVADAATDKALSLLQPKIEEARKEGFDDGVSKTTIAMDSTIDAQLGEARSQGIRMAIDNLKMHHCIVDVPARIKEIEEQALSGKGAGK